MLSRGQPGFHGVFRRFHGRFVSWLMTALLQVVACFPGDFAGAVKFQLATRLDCLGVIFRPDLIENPIILAIEADLEHVMNPVRSRCSYWTCDASLRHDHRNATSYS